MKKIFIVAFTILIISCNSKKPTLGLHLETGKTYSQVARSKALIEQSVQGQTMVMEMDVTASLSFLVKSQTDSTYAMEAKYDSLGMVMKTPNGSMEFNSEKSGTDLFSKILSVVKNKPFTLTMGRDGKISDIANVSSIFESAIDTVSAGSNEIGMLQKEQIKQQLMQSYGPDAFKGNIEMVTAIFPGRHVKKGEDWTVTTKLQSGMSADITTKYTLTEETKNHLVIKGDSKISTNDTAAFINSNGIPMRFDLNGTMTSDIKADPKTGWIIQSDIKQNIEGFSFVKESDQFPKGLKIPMKLNSEINVRNK